MNFTALIINSIAIAGLLTAFVKNKEKAIESLKMAGKSFVRILPMIVMILIVIDLLQNGKGALKT